MPSQRTAGSVLIAQRSTTSASLSYSPAITSMRSLSSGEPIALAFSRVSSARARQCAGFRRSSSVGSSSVTQPLSKTTKHERAKAPTPYLEELGDLGVSARSLRFLINCEAPRTFRVSKPTGWI